MFFLSRISFVVAGFLLLVAEFVIASPVPPPNDTNSVILYTDCANRGANRISRHDMKVSCIINANKPSLCNSTIDEFSSFSSSEPISKRFPGNAATYWYNGSHFFKVLPSTVRSQFKDMFADNILLDLPTCLDVWWSGSNAKGQFLGSCNEWSSYDSINGAVGRKDTFFTGLNDCAGVAKTMCACYTGPEYVSAANEHVVSMSSLLFIVSVTLLSSI